MSATDDRSGSNDATPIVYVKSPSWLRRAYAAGIRALVPVDPFVAAHQAARAEASRIHVENIARAEASRIRVENITTPDLDEVARTVRRDQRRRATAGVSRRDATSRAEVARHRVRAAQIGVEDAQRRLAAEQREQARAAGSLARPLADSSDHSPNAREAALTAINELVAAQEVLLNAEMAEYTAETAYRAAQVESREAHAAVRAARRRVQDGDH